MVEVAPVDLPALTVEETLSTRTDGETDLPALTVEDALCEEVAQDGGTDEDSSNPGEEGGSDSDPKDSGVDCGGPEGALDGEAAAEVARTVEFYLSDAHLLRDPFLLKHVRRSREGWVSVKLLASFRRVRGLCRSWKAVALSLRGSRALALNAEGTKVRRLAPLPDHDETAASRSLIAHGLGERPSVDSVGELFAGCGDVALVRILRPGAGSVPPDVKRFLARHPEIQAGVCALVEFEEHASARRALETVAGVKVVPLVTREKSGPDSDERRPETPSPAKESPKKKKKNRKASSDEKRIPGKLEEPKRSQRSGSMSSGSSGYLSSSPGGGPAAGFPDGKYPRRHSFNPSLYNDPNSSFASLSSRYNGSRDRLQKTGISAEASSGLLSPWRRRKEQMRASDAPLSPSAAPAAAPGPLPVKTVRSPRGPDGTRGFGPAVRSRLPSTAEEGLPAVLKTLVAC